MVIIGGGATGLGAAVDSAFRGHRTLLLEKADFASGTSSRSTKLIHGGVRYLRQGNLRLVLDGLRERNRLVQNAPHLVHDLSFVLPAYKWWEKSFYGAGLKLYDRLTRDRNFGASRFLSRSDAIFHTPTLNPQGLRGGVLYHDGQFDDARLAVNLAQTAADLGAVPLNYMNVTGLIKDGNRIVGVAACDEETGKTFEVPARVVINATGVFSDVVRRMDDLQAAPIIAASQGTHIVLDRSFLPGDSAVLVPSTSDGRVLFAIPWHGKVLVGTTDTPVVQPQAEPRATEQEVNFLLSHISRHLSLRPARNDVLSVFAGLRPLIRSEVARNTSALSRDHVILVSGSGLVTIAGGKWTTYRQMAEEAVDTASRLAGLTQRTEGSTRTLRIHGWTDQAGSETPWGIYGSDAAAIQALAGEEPEGDQLLHPALPYRRCEVTWAVRNEMARTVEDVLSRRTRSLLLDARASMEAAPLVAHLMGKELGRSDGWAKSQVSAFRKTAQTYILD